MAKTTTPRVLQTRWSSGSDVVLRTDFDTDAANIDAMVAVYGQGTLSARPAAGTPGRYYFVVGDATEANNDRLYYDTGTAWRPAGRYIESGLAVPSAATRVGFTVSGASGQIANLQEWRNSAGTVLSSVNNTGVGRFVDAVLGGTDASVYGEGATKPAARFKATGTTDSTQWYNAGGMVARVSSTGVATFAGLNVPAGATINDGHFETIDVNSTASATSGVFGATTLINTIPLAVDVVTAHARNLFEARKGGTITARVDSSGRMLGRTFVAGLDTSPTTPTTYMNAFAGVSSRIDTATYLGVSLPSQTAPVYTAQTSTGVTTWSVLPSGDTTSAGRSVYGGGYYTSTPVSIFGTDRSAVVDITTGTANGEYKDYVVYRHAATGTDAASRELVVALKLGGEADSADTAKFAGVSAYSTNATSTAPRLGLYANGSRLASVYADEGVGALSTGRLIASDRVSVTGATGKLLFATGNQHTVRTGADAMYFTSANGFRWKATDSNTSEDTAMYLDVADRNLYVKQASFWDQLNIGSATSGNVRFTGSSIESTINGMQNKLRINAVTKGNVTLGGGLEIGANTFTVAGIKVTFSSTAPQNPTEGDLWFNLP